MMITASPWPMVKSERVSEAPWRAAWIPGHHPLSRALQIPSRAAWRGGENLASRSPATLWQ